MTNFDLTIAKISRVFGQRPQGAPERVSDATIPRAAVALVIRNNGGVAEMLIIQRAVNPADHWSGHLALPGGRASSNDRDLVETALREVNEEVGLEIDRDQSVIGQLDDLSPRSSFLPPIVITPFVALAPANARITLSHEVAHTFWVPVDLLKREGPVSSVLFTIEGSEQSWPAFNSEKGPIWGITERIISTFLTALD